MLKSSSSNINYTEFEADGYYDDEEGDKLIGPVVNLNRSSRKRNGGKCNKRLRHSYINKFINMSKNKEHRKRRERMQMSYRYH